MLPKATAAAAAADLDDAKTAVLSSVSTGRASSPSDDNFNYVEDDDSDEEVSDADLANAGARFPGRLPPTLLPAAEAVCTTESTQRASAARAADCEV